MVYLLHLLPSGLDLVKIVISSFHVRNQINIAYIMGNGYIELTLQFSSNIYIIGSSSHINVSLCRSYIL